MNAFTADWLRLREPSDRAAREAAAAAMGEGWLAALRGGRRVPHAAGAGAPVQVVQVVDLGCGTGASLRYLAPRLGGVQHWRVCDHDEALLQAWPAVLADWARQEGHRVGSQGPLLHVEGHGFRATVERRQIDLAQELDALPLGETDLLCASALLDLVSQAWLAGLVERTRRTQARLCFSLVVDGRIEWDPALPGDSPVARAFAAHQGRDKGFGPALGAHAPAVARQLLEQAGYALDEARADWLLQAGPVLAAMIDGMAGAAREQEPQAAAAIEDWHRRRVAALARSRLCVGHVDLVARPPGPA